MATVTFGYNTGDTAGLEDVSIASWAPTTPRGDTTGLTISKLNTTTVWGHSLIKVTQAALTAAVPAGSTINSVQIKLGQEAHTGTEVHNYEVRRLLQNFVENEATYNVYSTGNNWATAGGLADGTDRVALVSVTLASDAVDGEYKTFASTQLTADYQGFLDGTYSNYGHHFEYDYAGGSISHDFYGSETGTDGLRPQIIIDYTAPAGGLPPSILQNSNQQVIA